MNSFKRVWTLEKAFTFEAAHRLTHHDGKCARLHGHSWRGRVIVQGSFLQKKGPKRGMVIDYGEIKAALEHVLETYLDHHYLNDTLGLEDPTSEHIAQWLYEHLEPHLPGLVAVVIEETCTSSCRFEYNYES